MPAAEYSSNARPDDSPCGAALSTAIANIFSYFRQSYKNFALSNYIIYLSPTLSLYMHRLDGCLNLNLIDLFLGVLERFSRKR